MHGYIHMLRNNGTAEGICGINMLASYPAKTSPNPPPPPTPGPTKCDFFSSCSEGETCCCSWRFIGVCLSWNCCTAKSAVCCDNNNYCCPASHPICDTKRNRCLKVCIKFTSVPSVLSPIAVGKQNIADFIPWWAVGCPFIPLYAAQYLN